MRGVRGLAPAPVAQATTDPSYSLQARHVVAALNLSRAALYKRRDLLSLARTRNGRLCWRPEDIERAGGLFEPRLYRADALERLLSAPAGYLEREGAPCVILPTSGAEAPQKRYRLRDVEAWIATLRKRGK